MKFLVQGYIELSKCEGFSFKLIDKTFDFILECKDEQTAIKFCKDHNYRFLKKM